VVLVVDCVVETQIQRVIARNGLPRDTIETIVAAQATRAQRLAAADWVIFNDQLSLDELRAQVFALPLNRT
jgi:dephospho-CoA kinase